MGRIRETSVCARALAAVLSVLVCSAEAAPHVGVIRSRTIQSPGAWQGLTALPLGTEISIAPFADTTFTVVAERCSRLDDGATLWEGRLVDLPGGRATVVVKDGCVAGAIHAGIRGEYAINADARGGTVRQLDLASLATCGDAGRRTSVTARDESESAGTNGLREAGLRSVGSASDCDDGTVIDLMVAYTTTARGAAGGTSQIEAAIDLAVADANAAFARSLIDTSVRLVHTEEVSYTETGQWMIDGPRLVGPNDGYLDGVHPLRDQYGADCVSLWVNSLDTGGIGYFPDGSYTGVGNSGFSMLRLDNAPVLTMAHELGHNLYCTHDRAHTSDVPFADYSYGYVEPGGAWQTIMAVSATAGIPYFANPNVNWPGPTPPHPGPTGVPEGQPNPCDIARTINQTRHIVANFRPTSVPGLPAVLYVRSDAAFGGDGIGWGSAFNDLNDAMCAAAGSGGAAQEVWVKAGTYRPDFGTGDRSATFHLADGVGVYGGFAGNETLRSQRDTAAHVTVLSGDIGTNGDAGDNAYHVVTSRGNDATAVLDGVTITGGNANGADPDDRGAGLYVANGGAPTLVNCTITGNVTPGMGAGVYASSGSTPHLDGCVISSNTASGATWPQGGGGLYNDAGATSVVTGTTFAQNSAVLGGGMANFFNAAPTLTDCVFQANTGPSGSSGGAVYSYGGCSPTFDRCTFAQNSADYGGAAASYFDGVPVFTNCILRANSAVHDGGGLYSYSNVRAAITNCLLIGNAASYGAGMNNLFGSKVSVVNCTIAGNTATGAGGGVYDFQSNPALTNVLLWQNRVGAAVDEGAQLYDFSSTSTIGFSTVQGWTGAHGGSNNNGSNPLFRDLDGPDNVLGTADDNARPRAGSPAINSGNNGAVPGGIVTDLDGRARIIGAAVDRGAYEFTTPAKGDFDGDGAIDLGDYAPFAACLNRPGAAPMPPPQYTAQDCRDAFDFNADGDVDLQDFAGFAAALGG